MTILRIVIPLAFLRMIFSESRRPLCANRIMRAIHWLLNVVPFGSGSTVSRCIWLFGHTT
jgi:hypothetical protein